MYDFINEKEISEAVKNALTEQVTVEKAINDKIINDEEIKESFKITNQNIKNVNDTRKEAISLLRRAKVGTQLYMLLCNIINQDLSYEMYDLSHKVGDNISELKKEREVLNLIKNTLLKLKKYNVADLNYDISVILSLLNEKNVLIYEQAIDYMNASSTRIKGFNVIPGTQKEEQKNVLDKEINEKLLSLGIK